MLEMLVGAAVRSLLLAAVVGLGLKLCRTRNPHVLLAAWTLVLGASLLMPAATRLAAAALPGIAFPMPRIAPILAAPQPEAQAAVVQPNRYVVSVDTIAPASQHAAASPAAARGLVVLLYAVVSAMLILRLIVGLALSWRIMRSAAPVRESWTGRHDVRASPRVAAPATFGAVILLPGDHTTWSPAKRSAVLAHEGAHVARRDFAVQIAASVNRAIFWFNPLSWWLQRHLSVLAEAASDDAAIVGLDDRIGYAEILLDVSTRGQRLPGAVAMARPATVGTRIERILSETTATMGISRRSRLLIAASILPLAVAVAGPLSATTAASGGEEARLPDRRAPHQRITVDPKLLEADEGFYEDMATGSVMTVTRDGDHLLTGRTGMPQVAEYPYADHDFFLTISAEQNTFVVDESGKVDHVIHYKNGLATTLERITPACASQLQADYEQRVAEELKPRTRVSVDPDTLDKDVGYYALTPTYIFSVTRAGDQLFVQGTDRKKFPVFAYSDHDFFYTVAAAQLTFLATEGRPATALVLHQDGRDRTAERVSAAVVQQLQQRLDDERKPHEPTTIAAPLLDDYVGRYTGPALTMIIGRDHDHLSAQVTGYNEYPIYAYTDHDFFATTLPAQISFVKDDTGQVTGLVRHEHGEDLTLNRIE
ncbi:M56 family metallopeptidase [Acidisphaera sp. S103]|uniref:M56 family metallopeptidase n=1 Tax=Acidisphaera sp. S103 TaxID=1747223 RepID=UPI00131B0071|nr:M56 family metallopeptidase [Acidisphaera sp. S103]